MNKKEALRQLSANLQKYLDNGFQFLTRFLNEFRELLNSASGHEKEIFALLVKQLNFVKALGKEVNQADGNEIIKWTSFRSIISLARRSITDIIQTYQELDDNLSAISAVSGISTQ